MTGRNHQTPDPTTVADGVDYRSPTQRPTKSSVAAAVPQHHSTFKLKAARCRQTNFEAYVAKMNDGINDLYINKAEDERTIMATRDYKDSRRVTIDAAHAATRKPKPTILKKGRTSDMHWSRQCTD